MSLQSMTGFARAEGADPSYAWVWEVKSVNGRGLDIRFRLPPGMDGLEPGARRLVSEQFRRGNVAISLSLAQTRPVTGFRVNRDLLRQLAAIVREVEGEIDAAAPSIDGLLALKGVIEAVEPEETAEAREQRETAILATLRSALDKLSLARAEEGERLATILEQLLDETERLTGEAAAQAAMRPDAIRARFVEQVQALLGQVPALPEERLAQEVAILIAKGDVREELDRLTAHIGAARRIVASGGDGAGAGRQLDFLTQEFNREANTLCSKSGDRELTRIGLAIKLAVDRLREQVQNIE
ncbi:MAG: YicC family protein [Alphaproteobacteria bacterium]|nr:YicC family protein [Alphaproteobacteria bacterium]